MCDQPSFAPLFRDVRRLPCPTLLGGAPDCDTNVMPLPAAALHWGLPAQDLHDFWVATFYPQLGLDEPGAVETAMGERPTAACSAQAYRVLRTAGYQQLTDPELAALLEFCRPRKLNPLARHVYPTWRRDQDFARLIEFRLTIDGMWEIARKGGGFVKHKTTHERGPDRWPLFTVVDVWREVDGKVGRFRGEVEFAARYPGPGKSEIWDKDPWRMNEKNAEAAALRKAYPDYLAGIYTIDEPGFNPSSVAAAARPRRAPGDIGMDPHRRQPWPDSLQQFKLALVDCGVRDDARRGNLEKALHAEIPDMSGPAFYREAMQMMYADPARWGIQLPEAA